MPVQVPQQSSADKPWRLDASIRRLIAGGSEWSYIDTGGGGQPLVMLPGSVGTCEMFFKQVASLPPEIRVISVGYPADPNPASLADGLSEVMSRIGLDRASILGSSFGGYWAQFFALRYPSRVDTLILGNIFWTPEALFSNPLFSPRTVRETAPAEFQQIWYERVSKNPESELRSIQLDMLGGRQSADNLHARFVGVIDAVACPSLPVPLSQIVVIDCEDDPIIPEASRHEVRERYRGASLRTLRAGGHYPHILNQPDYDRLILQSLSRGSEDGKAN